MLTILNRIFPNDISNLIYDLVIKSHINNIVVSKLYDVELIMEKFIRIHKPEVAYNLSLENDYNVINGIISNIYERFVVKKVYEFDMEFRKTFKNYIECLKFHNDYQRNYLTKNMIERIIINLNNIKSL